MRRRGEYVERTFTHVYDRMMSMICHNHNSGKRELASGRAASRGACARPVPDAGGRVRAPNSPEDQSRIRYDGG
jgi:hypothetical protein